MINLSYRILLSFNATSFLIIIFLVQKGYVPGYFLKNFNYSDYLSKLPNELYYFFYLMIPILSTALSLFLSKYLGKDEFKASEVTSFENTNNNFLPSYLGYFFVGLSITNWETLWFVYGVLFAFTFLSQALYYNPLFLLFGYEFYNITTKNGATFCLISKERFKKTNDINISLVYRINNYTFIERGKT